MQARSNNHKSCCCLNYLSTHKDDNRIKILVTLHKSTIKSMCEICTQVTEGHTATGYRGFFCLKHLVILIVLALPPWTGCQFINYCSQASNWSKHTVVSTNHWLITTHTYYTLSNSGQNSMLPPYIYIWVGQDHMT